MSRHEDEKTAPNGYVDDILAENFLDTFMELYHLCKREKLLGHVNSDIAYTFFYFISYRIIHSRVAQKKTKKKEMFRSLHAKK